MGRAPRSAFFVCLLALGMLATMLAPVAAEGVFGLDRGFAPMGSAYHWRPSLVGLHLVADTLIDLSYVAISVTLIYLAYKARHDIPFLWTFVAFGVFIIACGATHLMATVTIWVPLYWVAAAMKWVTAIASVCTAITLPPLVPQALALIPTA